ncbi:MAG: TIM barrel protein [Lachnospiraceae bacterium]
MKYSMCADIMFVEIGKTGPIWPDTEGIIDAMKLARSNDLDGIEIFDLTDRDLEKIRKVSEELGITIESCVSKGAVLLGDPEMTEELYSGFVETLQMAKEINCSKIIFNADNYARELSSDEVLEIMKSQLRKIVPTAEKNEITILVEPLSGGFFTSSKQAFDLIRAVKSENVKLLYDVFHFQNIEGNITNTIKENVDLIGDIHFAGSPMRGEITEGELNYSFILKQIKEYGYTGNICLEFFTFQNREEKVAVSAKLLV